MSPLIKWEPPWEPFEEMNRFFENYLPTPHARGFSPAVDVYQTKNDVVVETPLAGIDPKDIEISIEDDIVTIRGVSKKESEVEEKDYYRKEIRAGSFYRSVSLPAHVSGDKAKAETAEGMLTITIPKARGSKAKPIKITVKKKQ